MIQSLEAVFSKDKFESYLGEWDSSGLTQS